ncbi:MAG: MGMT family protein [Chloroflexi bacterium]|nr:MGMT family protein [Chloroflexota bacterium]
MRERQVLEDLRALGGVRAPAVVLPSVLASLELVDYYASLDTPLGPVYVAWNKRGFCSVMRSATAEEFESTFVRQFGRPVQRAATLPPDHDRRYDLRGLTEFERAVLLKALEIPRGQVRTYGWIAAQIGRPAAVRAVGTVLRKNPIPVLIPCHRVVRSDGHIGQYALGGSEAKRHILAAEGVRVDDIARLARGTNAVAM